MEEFLEAVRRGDALEVKEILRSNPTIDVNLPDRYGATPLQRACIENHGAVVAVLMSHPDIDIDKTNRFGETAFLKACFYENTSCAHVLLRDSRVNVSKASLLGNSPLKWAANRGCLEVIKWWIVSGREMDWGIPGDDIIDSVAARIRFETEEDPAKTRRITAIALLQRFRESPVELRHAVRMELGLVDEVAAEVFALVVFVSDGLLSLDREQTPTPATRFFNITRQLPLELQMVLCYRLMGSAREIILGKDSEAAFKDLAERI